MADPDTPPHTHQKRTGWEKEVNVGRRLRIGAENGGQIRGAGQGCLGHAVVVHANADPQGVHEFTGVGKRRLQHRVATRSVRGEVASGGRK